MSMDERRWLQLSAELFRSPLAEFVAQRKALAAQLARAKERALATRIRSLAKPSWVAFLVNQLFYEERDAWDGALTTGAILRTAQQGAAGDAGEMQQHLANHRAALQRLARQLEPLAQRHGQKLTFAHERKALETLEVLMMRAAPMELHGRLMQPLSSAGFDALAPTATSLPPPTAAEVSALRSPDEAPHEVLPAAIPSADDAAGERALAEERAAVRAHMLLPYRETLQRAADQRAMCQQRWEQEHALQQERERQGRALSALRDEAAQLRAAAYRALERAQTELSACQERLEALERDAQDKAAATRDGRVRLAEAERALAAAEVEMGAASRVLEERERRSK